ncbi:MAG: hypothetical protein AB2552_01155 [Candidatus Thiodiazotropha endolucinida]
MTDIENEGELLPREKGQIDLNALIPLGVQLIENNQKQAEAQIEIQKENLRLGEERLKIHKSSFTHKFWLLTFIVVSVLGIASGLIFLKDDTVSGMAMLSHIGAVIVGIIAGSGWERMRGK